MYCSCDVFYFRISFICTVVSMNVLQCFLFQHFFNNHILMQRIGCIVNCFMYIVVLYIWYWCFTQNCIQHYIPDCLLYVVEVRIIHLVLGCKVVQVRVGFGMWGHILLLRRVECGEIAFSLCNNMYTILFNTTMSNLLFNPHLDKPTITLCIIYPQLNSLYILAYHYLYLPVLSNCQSSILKYTIPQASVYK